MAHIPNPNAPDVNIGASLIALEWALVGIATSVLGLRLFTVSVVLRRVQLADYLMILAYICGVIQGALLTASFAWGLGRHFYYLSDEQRLHAMRFAFLLQGWGIACALFGRVSFCLFLFRIFSSNAKKKGVQYTLWFAAISQVVVNAATIIIIYTQCGTHAQALWDPRVQAKCLKPEVQTNISYFQSAWNSFTDLYLTILPAMMLKDLNINWTKKLIVIVLLSLSALALVASVVKTYWIRVLSDRGDFTWALVKLHYWAVSENYIVIIVASVPILNALIKRAKEHYGSGTELSKVSTQRGITVKNSWAIHRVEACRPVNTGAVPLENYAEEKLGISTISVTDGTTNSGKAHSKDDDTYV